MLKLKKINDVKVKPIDLPKVDICNIKGKDYFENLHPNILILARKNSGKTTILYNILKHCANKHTKVYIFCATMDADPSYKKILEMLDNKKIEHEEFGQIKDGKVNHLDNIVEDINQQLKDEKNEKESTKEVEKKPKTLKELMFGFDQDLKKMRKEAKPKKIAPKYIFVYDDISDDLRNKSLEILLKKNRHYGIMNIISTQSLKDITPVAWRQIDNAILLKNISDADLEDVYNRLNLPTTYETYLSAYDAATAGDYNFFYIDKNKVKYRRNFCEQFDL